MEDKAGYDVLDSVENTIAMLSKTLPEIEEEKLLPVDPVRTEAPVETEHGTKYSAHDRSQGGCIRIGDLRSLQKNQEKRRHHGLVLHG